MTRQKYVYLVDIYKLNHFHISENRIGVPVAYHCLLQVRNTISTKPSIRVYLSIVNSLQSALYRTVHLEILIGISATTACAHKKQMQHQNSAYRGPSQ